MSEHHKTVPVLVWADIDEGVAETVRYLNTISGVRTYASCQGTIGEGGPAPYRAQVMATWPPEAFERLSKEFDVTLEGDNWGYLHPRKALAAPPSQPDTGVREAEVVRWRQRAAQAEAVLEFIVAGYDNQYINHVDFRVEVYKAALAALPPDAGDRG